MIDERDIWRAAGLLLKHYGIDVLDQAAQRVDALFTRDDADRYRIWLRIFAAVAELARTKPAEGERVN